LNAVPRPDPESRWLIRIGAKIKKQVKYRSVTKIELINSSNGSLNPTELVCYYRVIILNNFIYTLLSSFLTKIFFIITRTRCNIFKLLAMSTVVYFYSYFSLYLNKDLWGKQMEVDADPEPIHKQWQKKWGSECSGSKPVSGQWWINYLTGTVLLIISTNDNIYIYLVPPYV
jgi:hypothetical protein